MTAIIAEKINETILEAFLFSSGQAAAVQLESKHTSSAVLAITPQ